jgi:hypothetical protein
VNPQRLEATAKTSSTLTKSDEAIALEGLEDLFKWAAETLSDTEDIRSKRMREQKMRRQVMEMVQREREQRAVARANVEISYLQKRVIALLQKLQESTEENATLKQTIIAQCATLLRLPELEAEVERLKSTESHIEKYQAEQQELLSALSRLKKDRDFLDDLLRANEDENTRLTALLLVAKTDLAALKSRRWWHFFFRYV